MITPPDESRVEPGVPRIDRGQPVTLRVLFRFQPATLDFLYIRPQEDRPIVDPGFGQEGSRIVAMPTEVDAATGAVLYPFAITLDTDKWKWGYCFWHFAVTSPALPLGKTAKRDKFWVRYSPETLV